MRQQVQTVPHIYTIEVIRMAKRKEMTYKIYVNINGVDVPWDSLSAEEKRKISIELNDRAVRAIGLKRKDKTA